MSKPERQPSRDTALLEAIEAVGGPTRLSERVGVSQSAISQWKRVPVSRVRAVADASGVAKEKLRPDIFGPPGVINA